MTDINFRRAAFELVGRTETYAVLMLRSPITIRHISIRTFRVLDACVGIFDLTSHAHQASLNTKLTFAEAQHEIEILCESGLLVPTDAYHRITEAPSSPNPVLVVTTADRPQLLRRCLESYLSHFGDRLNHMRLVVCDGSRSVDSVQANIAITRETIGRTGASCRHLDSAHCTNFIERCTSANFNEEDVRWLIGHRSSGYAAGAVRSLALLATAGSPLLFIDDDTIARIWRVPTSTTSIALVGHDDPRNTTFFDSRADAINSTVATATDIVSAHCRLLGRSVADLLHSLGANDSLNEACSHLINAAFAPDTQARVRASWAGIAGDSAVFCPYSFLFATRATRRRLISDRNAFLTALSSREVIRHVDRPTIIDEPSLMLYSAALDNSSLLPPFNPWGFNEDGLFGICLRAIDPRALIGQIPEGVVHDSSRPSRYTFNTIQSAFYLRLTDIIASFIVGWAAVSPERTVASRLQRLGEHLAAVASDKSDFRYRLTRAAVDIKVRQLLKCDNMSRSVPLPRYWLDALDEYSSVVLRAITHPSLAVPLEYRNAHDISTGLDATQEHVYRFGRSLQIWPDLWEYAKEHFWD